MTLTIPSLTFGDPAETHENVLVRFGLYAADNDLVAPIMQLYVDHGSGYEPLTEATVNVAQWTPDEGSVLIRDWGENDGLFEALESVGVIEATGLTVTANDFGSEAREGRVLPPYDRELLSVLDEAFAEDVE